ncbi:MAG: hypothetical protein V4560_03555 [Bacteroidota bacterium]
MKRLAFAILTITFLIFIVSSVDDLTKMVAKVKYKTLSWWGTDKYRYGDLYGFTYLSKFRVDKPQGVDNLIHFDTIAAATKKIDLYALSDSYGWEIFKHPSLFRNVNKITFTRLNDRQVTPITLDTTKKNILLLETSERNIRLVYEDTAYLKHFFEVKNTADNNAKPAQKQEESIRLKFKLNDIGANVEFNIWDYRFLTPFKEFKADTYYALFGRAGKGAYVSDDKKYLLYDLTIDTIYKQSSFKPIQKEELDGIISTLNNIYDLYRSKGFDEVYIAIIPNPVSILYPNYHGLVYNNLTTLVQSNKALKCKVIDANMPFKQTRQQIYCTSDSHWNFNGEKIWLSVVNNALLPFSN